jgi:hypothetical protein
MRRGFQVSFLEDFLDAFLRCALAQIDNLADLAIALPIRDPSRTCVWRRLSGYNADKGADSTVGGGTMPRARGGLGGTGNAHQ